MKSTSSTLKGRQRKVNSSSNGECIFDLIRKIPSQPYFRRFDLGVEFACEDPNVYWMSRNARNIHETQINYWLVDPFQDCPLGIPLTIHTSKFHPPLLFPGTTRLVP